MKTIKKLTFGKIMIYMAVTAIAAFCLLPLVLVVIVSFTAEEEIIRNGYSFFPSKWSLEAYKMLFENELDLYYGGRNGNGDNDYGNGILFAGKSVCTVPEWDCNVLFCHDGI